MMFMKLKSVEPIQLKSIITLGLLLLFYIYMEIAFYNDVHLYKYGNDNDSDYDYDDNDDDDDDDDRKY